LLARHVELGSPATRRDLEVLAKHTACPPHQAQLLALKGEAYEKEVLERRVSVLDLLERFPACALPFAELLELLPTLKPRRYSIASSPHAGERRCVLTVAVVDAPAWSGQGRYRGIASTYLQNVKPGDHVSVAVQPHAFRLPTDAKTPLILVAAGTGLAPFRGFIEERAKKLEAGETLAPALLFFGCDHPEVDYLYRDELTTWQQQGVVEVLPAFFHQPEQDVKFVQHRMLAEKERVRTALENGAAYYVCGDGRNMAPAAREALGKIYGEGKDFSAEQTEQWLKSLEKDGRYKSDVFGA
ncbi:MAG: cytochrome, partial [Myxococcaceae bacterium]